MPRLIALSGGIGGSKLVEGFTAAGNPEELLVVANTGDDFEHLGLHVSPDIDTLIYTVTGRVNRETGWGLANETWSFMAMLNALGGPLWFNLGDGDLALHVQRTYRLRRGESLSSITASYCQALSVPFSILPMSDDPVRTMVVTPGGILPMQNYFVEARCQPKVLALRYEGAQAARPNPALVAALQDPALEAIILCPSNPFLSIGPILAVPGIREMMAARSVPIIAVSPIVGGKALKGPTAKMMGEMGFEVSAAAVARHYRGFIDSFVLDRLDEAQSKDLRAIGVRPLIADTVMCNRAAKTSLARTILQFIRG